MELKFQNTLTRKKEVFTSIIPGKVSMYTCGPTVYHFAHIGNLRTYIFEDILKRTLMAAKYEVNHVMNITDVGHLQSDADEGQDKMELAAAREKKSPWDVAKYYESVFVDDCNQLGIIPPNIMPRATGHVEQMIQFVQCLESKPNATYVQDGNVYFNTQSFQQYHKLANINKGKQKSRVENDTRKQNQSDFVLWFNLENSKYPNQVMRWESPWGCGYPGWHIECSAMAVHYLGEHIDIHCGGIDHISVHHTNEIAQTETRTGKKWVNFWMHGAFLEDEEGKMSKSKGEFLTLKSLVDKGYDPAHYRYLCLRGHYAKPLKFSFKLLQSTKAHFDKLKQIIVKIKLKDSQFDYSQYSSNLALKESYKNNYFGYIGDDLNTKDALGVLHTMLHDDTLSPRDRLELMDEFDSVLGMGLNNISQVDLNPSQQNLVNFRNQLRKDNNYKSSDFIRDVFDKYGIALIDESLTEVLCIASRTALNSTSQQTDDLQVLKEKSLSSMHPDDFIRATLQISRELLQQEKYTFADFKPLARALLTQDRTDSILQDNASFIQALDANIPEQYTSEFFDFINEFYQKHFCTFSELKALLSVSVGDLMQKSIATGQFNINQVDCDGNTYLHKAALSGDETLVNLLHDNGADIFLKNRSDLSPAELAIQNQQTDIGILLLLSPRGDLCRTLNDLESYGVYLREQGSVDKSSAVSSTATQLQELVNNYREQGCPLRELNNFKNEFNRLLHSQDQLMRQYRINWNTIAFNLTIALTGIGGVLMAAKLIYSYNTDGRALFFGQNKLTSSEELVASVDSSLSHIEPMQTVA